MEQYIKELFIEIACLLPEVWEKVVFHGFFSEGAYDFALYVRKPEKNEFNSVMDLVNENRLPRQLVREKFITINELCANVRENLSPEERWNGITVTFDNDLHFLIEYEYEDTNQSHAAEWIKKNLV